MNRLEYAEAISRRNSTRGVPGKRVGVGDVWGPGSNTGQKGGRRIPDSDGAIIDYLTVVFTRESVDRFGCGKPGDLIEQVFGAPHKMVALAIRDRAWQFYSRSGLIVDREGEVVGRIGVDGNADTVCVSLTGSGCKLVTNWHNTARVLDQMGARITRCDIAYDDYDGERINVHAMREAAQQGKFNGDGRPPKTRFMSDEGHSTGCSLYVGQKGHKQLNVYEKGKEQGMPDSPWTRVEVRFYSKHIEGRSLPARMLIDPVGFLRGSYAYLAELLRGSCSVLKTERKKAEAKVSAMVEWFRTQCGKTVSLISAAFGGDQEGIVRFMVERIARDGSPGRFRGLDMGAVHMEIRRCLALS